jgi:hypothetical protein
VAKRYLIPENRTIGTLIPCRQRRKKRPLNLPAEEIVLGKVKVKYKVEAG